jgi:hypothetical protein
VTVDSTLYRGSRGSDNCLRSGMPLEGPKALADRIEVAEFFLWQVSHQTWPRAIVPIKHTEILLMSTVTENGGKWDFLPYAIIGLESMGHRRASTEGLYSL